MDKTPERVEIRLLGAPELLVDTTPVALERRKALALLAFLAVEPGEHPRDRLATLLAPEDDTASARAGLRRALAEIAPSIRPWLRASSDRIGLVRNASCWLDLDAFRQAIVAERFETAVQLYRGDFLAGFSLPGSAAFEEWQFLQSEHWRGVLADLLTKLSDPALLDGNLEQAIEYARRQVTLDPLDEGAHRRLMKLYASAGQAAAAQRQYRLLTETLEQELAVTPDPATTALYEQIRRGERVPQASRWSGAPPRLTLASDTTASAVELPTLPFLGRELELTQIEAALADSACRVLTLVGPGGMGKTRLAIQAANTYRHAFPDGVYQISLVGVSAPERMLTTIAVALGIAGQADQLDQMSTALRDRKLLLLLDNFDQALDGAPLLRGLIQRTQHLTLLITSRERLRLQEEWVIDLVGLAVPEQVVDPHAAGYSAIQLFIQRARQVRADFEAGPAILPDVVRICQMVEGMPLAIELAAAWIRVLSPAEIVAELTESMALLTTTMRDVPERHRSVEGVFAQAWERLSMIERQALQRLSIFDDGFTRAAGSEVAGATPLILASLADKALIRRDRTGRYALHELLRQFAARQLAANPEEEQATALRFCRFCMHLLEQRGADMLAAHQLQALAELEMEYDNLWKAWEWAIIHRQFEPLQSALEGFYRLHELRGWYSDGIQVLRMLIDAFAQTDQAIDQQQALLVARTRARLGALLCWVGQFGAAEYELQAALPILEQAKAELDMALVLTGLGIVAIERDDDSNAEALLQRGLVAYQALANQSGIAWALDALGDLAASRADYNQARELLNESSVIFSACGDQVSAAWSLSSLGRVLGFIDDQAAARQLLTESLALFERLGDRHGVATAHANLAELAIGLHDYTAAATDLLEALRLARAVGALPLVLDSLARFAQIFFEQGQIEQAHELASLIMYQQAAWSETMNTTRTLLQATTAKLGAAIAEQATRRGRSSSWEQAVARLLT